MEEAAEVGAVVEVVAVVGDAGQVDPVPLGRVTPIVTTVVVVAILVENVHRRL